MYGFSVQLLQEAPKLTVIQLKFKASQFDLLVFQLF